MSPSLGVGIGMGYVERDYAKSGTPINIMIRDKEIPASVQKIPLLKK
jgi:aminomethyltransferase